jgi:hypothetical protein
VNVESRLESLGQTLAETLEEILWTTRTSWLRVAYVLTDVLVPVLGGKIRRSSLLPSDPCPLLDDSSS